MVEAVTISATVVFQNFRPNRDVLRNLRALFIKTLVRFRHKHAPLCFFSRSCWNIDSWMSAELGRLVSSSQTNLLHRVQDFERYGLIVERPWYPTFEKKRQSLLILRVTANLFSSSDGRMRLARQAAASDTIL